MLKASLIGNLGNDPELRYSASGTPTLRMNVASNYRTRTPEGEWQEKTEWVRVTVLGTRAESLSQYLKKGSRVYADGRLEARPWTDRDNQVRAGLELLADTIEFMSPRADDEPSAGTGGPGGPGRESGGPPDAPAGGGPAPRSVPPRSRPVPEDEGDLKDLPF
jgi:single-strand DNA-binding protein